MRLKVFVPMLQTNDINRTIEWYESVLGFSTSEKSDDRWCRLIRDDIAIMFMRNDHLGSPHATATQYIYVDDVMTLWGSIEDCCSAEWGPEKMPYGMLEFAVKDPNGYLLSFGQPVV
jgi:uncharacterized glyoxalase superfamily protein PhnB